MSLLPDPERILEGVVTTLAGDGSAHVTPLGFRESDGAVLLAPFAPSLTLDNLRRHPWAAISLTDDVRVIAGCLTGRREWPLVACEVIEGWRLRESLAHLELAVEQISEDPTRPRFRCRVVARHCHAAFAGFNRAQAAVVEAAILVSRLDWLPAAKVRAEFAYLEQAVQRTAGAAEREAWRWLCDRVAEHPVHRNEVRA
jgi:uncharacterized protein